LALGVLLPVHVFQQVAGHQILKAHTLVALHQAGVIKVLRQ